MKTNSRMRLTLAALVLATFAGSLTGQAGDAGLQPVKLLSEAIRLRDEGHAVPGQMLVIVTNVILGPTVIDSVQLRAVPALEAPKG